MSKLYIKLSNDFVDRQISIRRFAVTMLIVASIIFLIFIYDQMPFNIGMPSFLLYVDTKRFSVFEVASYNGMILLIIWLFLSKNLSNSEYKRNLNLDQKKLSTLEIAGNSCIWIWHTDSNSASVGPNFVNILEITDIRKVDIKTIFSQYTHPEDFKQLKIRASAAIKLGVGSNFKQLVRVRNASNNWLSFEIEGKVDALPSANDLSVIIGILSPIKSPAILPVAFDLKISKEGQIDGVWGWSRNSNKYYASQKALIIFGLDVYPNTESNDWWTKYVDRRDIENLTTRWYDSAKQQANFFMAEFRLNTPGNEQRWIVVRCSVSYDQMNGCIDKILGSVTDITVNKITNELLLDRTEQLQTIFQVSPDGFVTFDNEFNIKYANQAFEKMFDVNISKFIGLSEKILIDYIYSLSGTYKLKNLGNSLEYLFANFAHDGKLKFDLNFKDCKKFVSAELLKSKSSSVSHILYLRDVSKESAIEEMKSRFIATTAHELRTPMASILGYSELLVSKRRMSEQHKDDCLESIYEQSKRMTQILDDLLDLAKLEAPESEHFNIQKHDLSKIVKNVVKTFAVPRGRSMPVVVDNAVYAQVDEDKAHRILMNILSNAYKYSLGGDVKITISPSINVDCVEVQVCDYGIGISPENQSRLFERFFRADPSGNIPGTGLGLSIVKELMERMGGEIVISSTIGEGTIVRLIFRVSPL